MKFNEAYINGGSLKRAGERKNESPTKTEALLRQNKTYDKQLDSVKRVHKQHEL